MLDVINKDVAEQKMVRSIRVRTSKGGVLREVIIRPVTNMVSGFTAGFQPCLGTA